MTNKTLGNILIASVALLLFTAVFEPSMNTDTAEALYGISGVMLFVFVPWAGFRLRKE